MKNANEGKIRRQCNRDVFEALKATGYFFNPKYGYLIHFSLGQKKIISSEWFAETYIVNRLKREYEFNGIKFNYSKAEIIARRIMNKLPKFNIELEGVK